MRKIIVNRNDSNQRLDKFLHKYLPGAPSSLLYKSIRKKRVKVNGRKADIKTILNENDVLELYINDEFFNDSDTTGAFMKIKPRLSVIYEDDNILLVNKEQGMLCHGDDKKDFHTLINHILSYLYNKGDYDPLKEHAFVPSLCNRIDRNTAGIVIAAKNAASLKIINQKIKDREITKYYICIALGIFQKKADILRGYLVKDSELNMVKIVPENYPNAKEIVTGYRVLSEKDGLSLVEVNLITGRTHQIRAHLSAIGHPLLGDTKYASLRDMPFKTRKQYLVSHKLGFDFKTDGDLLQYLNNKEFVIEDIPFVKNFKSGLPIS